MDGAGRQVSGDDLIFSAYGHAVDPVRISASRESRGLAAHLGAAHNYLLSFGH